MSSSASEVNETGKRGVSRGGEGERRAVKMAANALHWSFCFCQSSNLREAINNYRVFSLFSTGKLPKYVEKISSVTEILIFVGFIDTVKPRRGDEIDKKIIIKKLLKPFYS